MITFYDMAAKPPIKTASPNTWRTRFVLNYKKLSYKTVYVELPDIESEFKKLGIPPSTRAPGQPNYTCPSIIDHSNNTPVTDSYAIAEYLDKAYPDTPKVIPPGTEALQAAFCAQFFPVISPVFPFLLPRVSSTMTPASLEYFVRTRTETLGKEAMTELQGEERVQAWKKVEAAFDTLYGWLKKSPGPYFMGETITFADFIVGSMLNTLEFGLGQNSKEWADITRWNDGRWAALKKSLEPFANTDD